MTLAIRWAQSNSHLAAPYIVEEGAQWSPTKLYIHWPVRTKTPYTLPVFDAKLYIHWGRSSENFIYIGRLPRKLHIHWAIVGPQWMLDRCLKNSHRKKKWHWFTTAVTKSLLKYHFIVIWVYYNYTTLTPCKTSKLLFLNGKIVKCWRFHTAGVGGSKPSPRTKNFPLLSTT
jgi:hypothetical protein